MGDKTGIQWTDATWNPVTGCTKISSGCKNCYAETMAHRLKAMGAKRYENGFDVSLHYDALSIPLKWTKPRKIFVNSMSDLFHDRVPYEFIYKVFTVMRECKQHTFQVLTKRAERMADYIHFDDCAPDYKSNILLGVSVEDQNAADERIHHLLNCRGYRKFLSVEPMIGPVDLMNVKDDELGANCNTLEWGINWVICGGESGPNARPIEADWVRKVRDDCETNSVPFFFKQWGGVNKKTSGRILDGRTHDDFTKES